MGCFHCGGSIGWLRKRTDPDFCSTPHRRKYHSTMRSVLARLAEEGDVPEWADAPAETPLMLPEPLPTPEDKGLSQSQHAA